MPQISVFPNNILHQPVYVVPYFNFDPWYDETDAQFITLGWAQWNKSQHTDKPELSVKVVRHSGRRWSRQSEELPLPRAVDATILIALAYEKGDDFVQIEAGTFENQTDPIAVAYGSKWDRTEATKSMRDEGSSMRSRLRALYDVLQRMHDRGLI